MRNRLSSAVLFFLILAPLWGWSQTLVINEWMAKNSTVLADEDGDYSDWLEIYNLGPSAVELTGFGLSDDSAEPYKWLVPNVVLQPNQFLVFFCSGKNRVGPEYHTNFKLSHSERIVLTDGLGNTLDEKEITTSEYDISEGYIVDGSGNLTAFYESTPASPNLNGRLHNKLNYSHESGFYTSSFNLNVDGSEPHEIRFTINGAEPTLSDPIWSGSAEIVNRTTEPNSISTIPTNASNLSEDILWEEPSNNVFKGTVLRFRSFEAGLPTSHTLSQTFFIHQFGSFRYSLSLVSIITDSLGLFDYDSGIYVPGAAHDADPNGGGVWGTGNYTLSGDEWERKAHVQLFDESGELELTQDVGIRIHGTGSASLPQKSLRIYAREKYGETDINHQVFDDVETEQFDVLLLRNMGQDFMNGIPQDVLAHELVEPLHQAQLGFSPAIVFINGEYWGIQNIRERFDKHYLAQFHDLDKDSIDIIESYYGGYSLGDAVAFFELYNFMAANSLSGQSNYDFVASKMDIEDFIDNTLTRIYMGCYDWPGNNIKIWRERSSEGKFRWLLLDSDVCIGNAAFNSLEHATEPNNPGWPNPHQSTLFLRRLLENEAFKQQFITRMAELLNTAFDKDLVGVKFTELFNIYEPEYTEHNYRWSVLDASQTLEQNYVGLIDVVRRRSCHVREHFLNYFNLPESDFMFECDSSSLALSINDLVTNDEMAIYPNPTSGSFTIDLNSEFTTAEFLVIYDMTGRAVFSEKLQNSSGNSIIVPKLKLASGIYNIRVFGSAESFSGKLIIQTD